MHSKTLIAPYYSREKKSQHMFNISFIFLWVEGWYQFPLSSAEQCNYNREVAEVREKVCNEAKTCPLILWPLSRLLSGKIFSLLWGCFYPFYSLSILVLMFYTLSQYLYTKSIHSNFICPSLENNTEVFKEIFGGLHTIGNKQVSARANCAVWL